MTKTEALVQMGIALIRLDAVKLERQAEVDESWIVQAVVLVNELLDASDGEIDQAINELCRLITKS